MYYDAVYVHVDLDQRSNGKTRLNILTLFHGNIFMRAYIFDTNLQHLQ